jgi:hypothetical protein
MPLSSQEYSTNERLEVADEEARQRRIGQLFSFFSCLMVTLNDSNASGQVERVWIQFERGIIVKHVRWFGFSFIREIK